MSTFDGKVALVTGGGSGIGAAVGRELASHGAKVVLADLALEAAESVAREITDAGGQATALEMDAATHEGNERAVRYAVTTYGALHLAVNNAGISGPKALMHEMDLAVWDRIIQLDLNGVVYGMHHQLKQFMAQEDPAQCAIVNVSSIHGHTGVMNNSAYAAAKHALLGVVKTAATEYSPKGIRITAVSPGYISTPLLAAKTPAEHDQLVGRHPIGRLGTAEEVARAVRFLLSDDASFVTGTDLLIDGGYTAV